MYFLIHPKGLLMRECSNCTSLFSAVNVVHSKNQPFFSCQEQLNRWPCSSLGWSVCHQTNNQSLHNTTKWPQRLVTFETFDQGWDEGWQDITTYLQTYPPTYLPTFLFTSIREHPNGAILETCDPWDIWSGWWEQMTWPKIHPYLHPYPPTHLPTYPPTHLPT